MMTVPFISFDYINAQIREEVLNAYADFFDAKWYVLGEQTKKFEEEYARFSGTAHCAGVSNGLDALHLALRALEVGPGDEVIVPSNTYIATVLAVSYVGATPVFVEPRLSTFNLDPKRIEEAITPHTKVIMPVHLYGQACEMTAIMKIAEVYDLRVVEDNAQAHGATYDSQLTGSFGDLNGVSFYPTKNLGALGEAGAVTSDQAQLVERVKVLRNYGSGKRYYNAYKGFNNRIDESQAAILRIKLKYLPQWTEMRREIANAYHAALAQIDEIVCPQVAVGAESVHHLYVIRAQRRDELHTFLKDRGIATIIHYPIPPHLQQAYQEMGYARGAFPIAEEISDTVLSLPIYPGLTEEQVQAVADGIRAFYGS